MNQHLKIFEIPYFNNIFTSRRNGQHNASQKKHQFEVEEQRGSSLNSTNRVQDNGLRIYYRNGSTSFNDYKNTIRNQKETDYSNHNSVSVPYN
ncbi:hypothetical protein K502DRAFT_351001 [Neoconidiobolus thromboides FSU 785]|nr:hypothetical protein K502DRAFT_351001 [Neoconidiobolus thromboides FSU 785]